MDKNGICKSAGNPFGTHGYGGERVKQQAYSGYWISIVLGMKMLCSALEIILKHGFNTALQSLKCISEYCRLLITVPSGKT